MQERILTPEQVAQILQVHPFTVLKFIKQGKLHASKLGRVYRIRESDLDNFLDQTSGRPTKAVNPTEGSEQKLFKIKNKNKTSPNKSDPSNPAEKVLDTTETEIPVTEAKVDQVETQGNKTKHGGEDHYYILH